MTGQGEHYIIEQLDRVLKELNLVKQELSDIKNQDMNERLSIAEAAKYTGRSRTSIKNYCYGGKIPYEQPEAQGKITVLKRDLLNYIKRV